MARKKKKNDISLDMDGDDVAIDFGPIKIRGSKGPTEQETKLKYYIQQLKIQNEKIRTSYYSMREKAIRQEERLSFYRQLVGVLLPKLESARTLPDGEQKEAIEKIQKWIKDLTKDDNLEG